jgi:hypothetical protein
VEETIQVLRLSTLLQFQQALGAAVDLAIMTIPTSQTLWPVCQVHLDTVVAAAVGLGVKAVQVPARMAAVEVVHITEMDYLQQPTVVQAAVALAVMHP